MPVIELDQNDLPKGMMKIMPTGDLDRDVRNVLTAMYDQMKVIHSTGELVVEPQATQVRMGLLVQIMEAFFKVKDQSDAQDELLHAMAQAQAMIVVAYSTLLENVEPKAAEYMMEAAKQDFALMLDRAVEGLMHAVVTTKMPGK